MRFDAEFLQVFVIFGHLEAPILRVFGTERCKKKDSEQKYAKSVKNESASFARKNVMGGALIKQENKTSDCSDIGSNTPWRA